MGKGVAYVCCLFAFDLFVCLFVVDYVCWLGVCDFLLCRCLVGGACLVIFHC
jgi:hypothetical protein